MQTQIKRSTTGLGVGVLMVEHKIDKKRYWKLGLEKYVFCQ